MNESVWLFVRTLREYGPYAVEQMVILSCHAAIASSRREKPSDRWLFSYVMWLNAKARDKHRLPPSIIDHHSDVGPSVRRNVCGNSMRSIGMCQ